MNNRMMRAVAGGLLALALVGCDPGGPAPVDPAATATAQAVDQATVGARQQIVKTFTANEQVTATAQAALFARIGPLIAIDLQDAGPIIVAGTPMHEVRLNVTNHDQVAHQVVIRLYDKAEPLNLSAYSSSDSLAIPAGQTAIAGANTVLPFADVAAQLQQLDGIAVYGPPTP